MKKNKPSPKNPEALLLWKAGTDYPPRGNMDSKLSMDMIPDNEDINCLVQSHEP